MKGLAAIVRLELQRTWLLLPVAVALGFVPFAVAPLLEIPGADTRGVAAVLSFLLASAAALLLGATAIAGDLGTGRLGFYFIRPLPWWAIWGGKLSVAVVLTVLTAALAMLPAWLLGSGELALDRWTMGMTGFYGLGSPGLILCVGLAVIAIGLAHWAAVATRSRSAWLVLDVVALPLVAWLWADALWRIVSLGMGPAAGGVFLLLAPATLAVLVAGAVQVAEGRTSASRSHMVASLTGWTLLALLGGAWQLAASRTVDAPPDRLQYARIEERAPAGGAAVVQGAPRLLGFRPMWPALSFLVDDVQLRRVEGPDFPAALTFSGDGTRAIVLRRTGSAHELASIEVRSGAERVVPLRDALQSERWFRRTVVDEEGRRIAVIQRNGATIHDVSTGERLASIPGSVVQIDHPSFPGERLAAWPIRYVFFGAPGGDDLVYRTSEDGGLSIERLVSGGVEATGRLRPPARGTWGQIHIDARGEHLLAVTPEEVVLADARTGETHLELASGPGRPFIDGLLLAGGRLLIAEAIGGGSALRLLDPSGAQLSRAEIAAAGMLRLTEAGPGWVVASGGIARTLEVLELDPLRLVRTEPDLWWRPANPWLPARRDIPLGGDILVSSSDGRRASAAVLRYDVRTGERTPVAGAAGR